MRVRKGGEAPLRRPAGFLASVILLITLIDCTEGCEAKIEQPGSQHIERIHRLRCGKCHTRVEPGERTRPQFEAALARHRKRVLLTEEEWAQMLDYLAPSASP